MINTSGIFLSLGYTPAFDPALTFPVTATSPGINNIINITAIPGGINPILPGQTVTGANVPFGARVMPYGTNGASGTGSTGTYALSVVIGNIIASETMQVSFSQFGVAGPGAMMYDPNSYILYVRNTANTGWTALGNVNTPNLGLLPRAGGALSSAMTGSSGLLTADGNTPFVAPPYVSSKKSRAATLADVANLQSVIAGQINSEVNTSIQQIGTPGLLSNITFGHGQFGLQGGSTIVYYPIPITGLTYADGTLVQQSDCYGFASIATWNVQNTFPATTYCQPQPGSNGMLWAAWSLTSTSNAIFSFLMNYFVIAIKPTA